MLEGIYAYVSDYDEQFDDILWLDEVFTDLCDILESNLFKFKRPAIGDFDIPELEYSKTTGHEIIVLCSGGKDSAAVAYYYKKLGYTVHLYHAIGINKAYGDEQKAAEKIAKYLDCDLYVDKLWAQGPHKFIEHPMKNYAIANGAIHYALENHIPPIIATGNFSKSLLDLNPFEVCAGDCVEMWRAYEKIIRKVIPDFRVELPLETNADTFKILSKDWDLFNLTISCMSPYRFRAHWKHRTEERYNVRLFDNRCGCCWKCCIEAMWLMDTDKMDYNEEYYLHCVDILNNTIKKETGSFAMNLDNLWENYMFYPMSESRAYGALRHYKTTTRRKRRKK